MVRTSDASPLIDLSGVQTYVDHNKKEEHVVYLHNADKTEKCAFNNVKCNHCGQKFQKKVQESFQYCSIGCKVSATGKEKKDGERATPSGGGGAGSARPEGEGREGPVPSGGRLACARCPQAPAEADVEAAEPAPALAADAASYGSECVGRKVAVFWDLDRAWHNGCIIGLDPATRKHAIRYEPTPRQRLRGEDGDTEEVELALEEIVFEETEARAPLDVTKSAAVSEIRAGGGEEAGGAWSPAAAGEDGPAPLGILLLDTPEADRTSPSAAEQPPLELVLESLPAEDEITVRPVQPAPDRALVDHPVAREAFISEAEDTPTGNAGAPKTAVKRLLDTVPLALASGASPLMRLGEWGYAKLTGAGGLQ